ncbi:tyrosine-protein phosphatase [Colwellia sp. 20A7]|uniref:tyrosine-protein phosphatase n=1 Tax=Colwellia sp. 20A7 TaxID=2689569 RepID=UPI00135C07DA|nr:tyrosine-protein phosphatase [Colwellia sp. 20A7]
MNNIFINLDDLSFEVTVNDNCHYIVTWKSGVQLQVIPSTNALALCQTVGSNLVGAGRVEITIDIPNRIYFHIFDGNRKIAVTSDRCIALKGVRNFRDLGGYKGEDGKPVRWGNLYRSGELSKLCTADHQLWQSLNIGLVIDFRSTHERTRKPTNIPSQQKTNISILEIDAGNTTKIINDLKNGITRSKSIQDMMIDFNRHFVMDQSEIFKGFFELIVNQREGVLFHCSAGKDRTGFAAALLLSSLGVSHDQIMQDYLLTSHYFIAEQFYKAEFSERFVLNVPFDVIKPLLEVKSAYLNSAFDTINKEYKSVDNYLTKALGVTSAMRKTLQSLYLQD